MDPQIALELVDTVAKITQKGKGILAADESTGTIKKRFDAINVENTIHNRGAYRELLFTTPGLENYISGVILYEETLYAKSEKGTALIDPLLQAGIVPGIKVDKGLVAIPCTHDEKSTQGLDGLASRCQDYYQAGARFAKWRAVLEIDAHLGKPSPLAIQETVHTLARYASICQQNRLVPIVEPEILTDGSHSIEVCADITEMVWAAQFKALNDHKVFLEGALFKPSMVKCGSTHATADTPDKVAYYTVRTIQRTIPVALKGIVFLSGGQSEEEASINLNAMNRLGPHPWSLSFSFGRALQASVLKAWQGKTENVAEAQKVLLSRARANSEAAQGIYQGSENVSLGASASLYEAKYVY